MSTFILHLHDAYQIQHFENLISFVGSDESGSFGIRSQHVRMMTILNKGLSSFTLDNGDTRYLASSGAVVYFDQNQLTLSALRFFVDSDHRRVRTLLEQQIDRETAELSRLKDSLQHMEDAMLQRLWELERTR